VHVVVVIVLQLRSIMKEQIKQLRIPSIVLSTSFCHHFDDMLHQIGEAKYKLVFGTTAKDILDVKFQNMI